MTTHQKRERNQKDYENFLDEGKRNGQKTQVMLRPFGVDKGHPEGRDPGYVSERID